MRLPPLAFLFAAVAAAAAPLEAQVIQVFGSGCALEGDLCTIGSRGVPQVGRDFELTYTGPNALPPLPRAGFVDARPHLVLGFTPSPPLAVQPGWFPRQPAGCTGLVTADVLVPMPVAVTTVRAREYAASITLRVPPDPSLAGVLFFAQWWTRVRDAQTHAVHALLGSDAAAIVVAP